MLATLIGLVAAALVLMLFFTFVNILMVNKRLTALEKKLEIDRTFPIVSTPNLEVPEIKKPENKKAPSQSERYSTIHSQIKSLFTDNLIAKIGLLVLFLGIGFLLKFVVQQNILPIELRLLGVGLAGMVMVMIGWYLSSTHKQYAHLLQGGGIGLMYLTVYAAFAMYQLLTPLLAFSLLLILVILSGMIAVVQDAKLLAIFSLLGGYFAPILISMNSSNHILLFTYYLILNSSILVTAWYKAWRDLNLIGFVFTFIISALWGWQAYQPEFFHSTELFLIIFFLFYVAIPILFSFHHQIRDTFLDTTLLFGVPIAAFSLQIGLVKNISYGLAWSSFALCLFYASLAFAFMLTKKHLPSLISAFWSLAIIFGTLIIPFTFSSIGITASWAIESIALLWFGTRQEQKLTRLMGEVILLISTMIYFIHELAPPIINGFVTKAYLSGLLVAIANFNGAYFLFKLNEKNKNHEYLIAKLFFILGWMIWYFVNLYQIIDYPSDKQFILILLLIANSSLLASFIGEYYWQWMRYIALLLLPAMILLSLPLDSYFHATGIIYAWIYCFAVHYIILYRQEVMPARYLLKLHLITFLFLTWFIALQTHLQLQAYLSEFNYLYYPLWDSLIWGSIPIAMLYLVNFGNHLLPWPLIKYEIAYKNYGGLFLSFFIIFWLISTTGLAGNTPFPYLPLLNPLDMLIVLGLYILFKWSQSILPWLKNMEGYSNNIALLIICLLSFIWLNAVLFRTIHQWFFIPYMWSDLLNSMLVQTCLSILWTLLALIGTFIAARTQQRNLWFFGFVLILVVIIKLFLVDLGSTNTLERIITFIGVGILLLINGYISPLPPKK